MPGSTAPSVAVEAEADDAHVMVILMVMMMEHVAELRGEVREDWGMFACASHLSAHAAAAAELPGVHAHNKMTHPWAYMANDATQQQKKKKRRRKKQQHGCEAGAGANTLQSCPPPPLPKPAIER